MKSFEAVETRLKEFESLKEEMLKINDEYAIAIVKRCDHKIEELKWVLGLD